MSLRRRGSVWWIDFVSPNGLRVRRSAGTADRALAQELHDRLKAEAWRIAKLGERPRRTWNDAVVRWLKEASHKATIETDKMHLRWLDRFARGKHLDEINRSWVDRILDARLAEGVSNATVNRTLEVLRAILRRCVYQWEWLDRAPQVRMLKEPTRRVRFLTREEARRLLAALPEHLSVMAAFSLATGLRRSNVTGLQWTQVDLVRRQAWIHPDQAKARIAIASTAECGGGRAHAWSGREASYARVQLPRASRSSRSVRRLGIQRSNAQVSKTSAGTTYGIPGRAGTCRMARRFMLYRNSAVGRVQRWCGVMRTSRRSIWLRTRIDCACFCEWWRICLMAQIRHSPQLSVKAAMLSCCRNWRARRDSNSRPPGS